MSQHQLTAGLIVIGNEILSGRTQDTNTHYLANKLTEKGIVLKEVRVIPDREDIIIATVLEMKDRVDTLFTTGGIGPTHDDITALSIARAFGAELWLDPEARQMLLDYYGSEDQLTEPRLKMTTVPREAKLIKNPVSGAPGFQIDNVYVMAGVPRIMQAMLDNILNQLQSGPPILSNSVTCNFGESAIAKMLEDIQNRYTDVEIGSYPHYRSGEPSLSLVLRSVSNDSLHEATGKVIAMIRELGQEPRAISLQTTGKVF